MGVNNIGSNMLSNIIGTRTALNLGAPESMKASRHLHAKAFQRGMASSSAKLDPVQVKKKVGPT